MPKKKADPNSVGYTNALLEDVANKFEAVLEATQLIGDIQENVKDLLADVEEMKPRLDATFDIVGKTLPEVTDIKNELLHMRQRLEAIEAAYKLLDREDSEIDAIKQRLQKLEKAVSQT